MSAASPTRRTFGSRRQQRYSDNDGTAEDQQNLLANADVDLERDEEDDDRRPGPSVCSEPWMTSAALTPE